MIAPEFIIDEKPMLSVSGLRDSLIDLLRREYDLRKSLRDQTLDREEQARREGSFLKLLIESKERRCDQFVAAARAKQGNASEVDAQQREESEKWLRRMEMLQQSLDGTLLKHGVTRYEPSGKALPERDEVKDTVSGTGLEPGTIVEILKPGYLWRGEVLRVAEVLVAE